MIVKDAQLRELESGAYGLTERNALMSAHTSFRVGGPADLFIEPTSEKELVRCVRFLYAEGIPHLLVGNGSNLLVRDGGIRGAVIHLGKYYSDAIIDGTQIRAQAGMGLTAMSKMSFRAGLTGMEPLSGIPGSVGGAVTMNAGAYGQEMQQVVCGVRALNIKGEVVELSGEELEFSYRHSRLQREKLFASEVLFCLESGDEAEIQARYADYTMRRQSKQPLELPSAGSTFKRPVGNYASALIDQAGLRGFSVGAAQVSEKHCGFIVNRGGASAAEILDLIRKVQARVKEKFGVQLEPEVRIVGEEICGSSSSQE
uniref:UDP-N-acetylmuramate dehydrogenase n=1 Tax=Ndongobacter massiliensis TaxID=1871025 RepID=UPI0009F813A1|nr:UDP-N-acetylmuramate dehydrogenase [Ndongobacter massiliensis]